MYRQAFPFRGLITLLVYVKDHYIIFRAGKEYIAHNTKKRFKDGHTHLRSFNMAKTIIHNVIKNKRPNTKNRYLLESHIRLTGNEKYKQMITELKQKERKLSYRNNTRL